VSPCSSEFGVGHPGKNKLLEVDGKVIRRRLQIHAVENNPFGQVYRVQDFTLIKSAILRNTLEDLIETFVNFPQRALTSIIKDRDDPSLPFLIWNGRKFPRNEPRSLFRENRGPVTVVITNVFSTDGVGECENSN